MAIIVGTEGNDRYNDPSYPGNVELKGTNLADQMYGLAGDDELVGFDGDDVLEGGQGADVLWGGYGLDLASYRGSDQGVAVGLRYSYATGGHAEGDILHEIEGVIGSAFNDGLGATIKSTSSAARTAMTCSSASGATTLSTAEAGTI